MAKQTYSEKLKDPRWQKKRLEVMKSDDWTCQFCGEKEKTLNVHHFVYAKSGNPWDVNDCDLCTLCEDCHHISHSKKLSEDAKALLSYIHLANYRFPGIAKYMNQVLLTDLKKYL
ncbi:MAG TPA: hypothetical protein VEA37_14045 [Flavobacterium sp.]|nr:hypothetical protein [Flavobacterium sp.]